jgi:hypothetical protein
MKMRIILGVLLLSTTSFAASVQTYDCSPDPLVPGFGYVVQVFEGGGPVDTAQVKVIRQGRVIEDVTTRKSPAGTTVQFLDVETGGQELALYITDTWKGRLGFVSTLIDHEVTSHYTCKPIN